MPTIENLIDWSTDWLRLTDWLIDRLRLTSWLTCGLTNWRTCIINWRLMTNYLIQKLLTLFGNCSPQERNWYLDRITELFKNFFHKLLCAVFSFLFLKCMRYALLEVHLRSILYNATCFVRSESRAPWYSKWYLTFLNWFTQSLGEWMWIYAVAKLRKWKISNLSKISLWLIGSVTIFLQGHFLELL